MRTKATSPSAESLLRNSGDWEESVPADLLPAVKHLRKSFEDQHFGCGHTTQRFCYSILHNVPVDDPEKEYFNYLMAMKVSVGKHDTQTFHHLLRQEKPSSLFKAFLDLYLGCMSNQALQIFRDLTEVGLANQGRLDTPHLQWAEAQTSHLIRSERHQIPIWIRNVCDVQVLEPDDDPDEWVFRRKWQAPMFLIMEPSRYRPYDEAQAWERNNPQTSARWLESFADHYVLHLEIQLRKTAGNAALELAKKVAADDVAEGTAPRPLAKHSSSRNESSSSRSEVRKANTKAKHRRWQKEYRKRKRQRPEMSDVWHATQIAKLSIAEGNSVDTVRKNMKS